MSTKLWHDIYGHIGMSNLKILHDEKLANELNLNEWESLKGMPKESRKEMHFQEMKLHVYLKC